MNTTYPRSHRRGQIIHVQPQHQRYSLLDSKDKVVRAIAWDDGGAEFVFGDGSVFSFCDCMSTFVAFTPRGGSEEKVLARMTSGTNPTTTAQSGGASVPGAPTSRGLRSDEQGSLYESDMLFTAWALSRYEAKVKDALGLFNYYSVTPRLIDGLIASPVQAWHSQRDMTALILAKDKRLLERRRVRLAVPVASSAKVQAKTSQKHYFADITNQSQDGNAKSNEVATRLASEDPDATVVREVEIGVEVTLWCALRQTSLTLHANGATFTVRWPAPVAPAATRSRSSLIPAGLFEHEPDFSASYRTSDAADLRGIGAVGKEIKVTLLREALQRKPQFTLVTQCFPVANPPAPWLEMLHTALALHAETPEGECYVGEKVMLSDRSEGTPPAPTPCAPEDDVSTLYLTLPPVAVPTQRSHACHFSRLNSDQVPYLVAAGAHMEGAVCNRLVHGDGAKVLWRYEADPTGREPCAVYWNLDPTLYRTTPNGVLRGGGENSLLQDLSDWQEGTSPCPTGSVLAVVREDDSTLLVTPGRQGATVQHHRCDGSVRAYHVSHDGDISLPPASGTLTFPASRVRRASPLASLISEDEVTGSQQPTNVRGTPAEMPLYHVHQSDLVRSQQLSLLETTAQNVQLVSSPFYSDFVTAAGDVTAIPFLPTPFSLTTPAFTLGRYLPVVGTVAVHLSHHLLQAERTVSHTATAGRIAVDAAEGDELMRKYLHPQASREAAVLAGATDASSYRASFLSENASAMRSPSTSNNLCRAHHDSSVHATVPDTVVFLSTRLDGVGTFTALTNGVVRCSFDDRTLLTIVPGANDFDEEGLLATCLFRDATRCTLRLCQCMPTHPMFRYVSFALPFRRYVLARATEQRALRSHGSGVGREERLLADLKEAAVHDNSIFSSYLDPVGSSNPHPSTEALFTPVTSRDDGKGPNAGGYVRPTDVTSLPTSPIGAADAAAGSSSVFARRGPFPDGVGSGSRTGATEGPASTVGLCLSHWRDTMHDLEVEYDAALQAQSDRLSALLSLNDSIGSRNKSLLREQ